LILVSQRMQPVERRRSRTGTLTENPETTGESGNPYWLNLNVEVANLENGWKKSKGRSSRLV